jgi:hypothetical protein
VNNRPIEYLVGDTLEQMDNPFDYIGMDSDGEDS